MSLFPHHVNIVVVSGFLAKDAVEVPTKPGKDRMAGIQLAYPKGPGNKAAFLDVVAYGDTAGLALDGLKLKKGDWVYVIGRIDSYFVKQMKRMQIVADRIIYLLGSKERPERMFTDSFDASLRGTSRGTEDVPIP